MPLVPLKGSQRPRPYRRYAGIYILGPPGAGERYRQRARSAIGGNAPTFQVLSSSEAKESAFRRPDGKPRFRRTSLHSQGPAFRRPPRSFLLASLWQIRGPSSTRSFPWDHHAGSSRGGSLPRGRNRTPTSNSRSSESRPRPPKFGARQSFKPLENQTRRPSFGMKRNPETELVSLGQNLDGTTTE